MENREYVCRKERLMNMCYKIEVQNKNAEKLNRKLDELNAPQFLRGYLNELIETVVHMALTKRELIDLINKSFPDEEVGNHGQIAQLSTTTMSDGTKMQNVCFGKILKV